MTHTLSSYVCLKTNIGGQSRVFCSIELVIIVPITNKLRVKQVLISFCNAEQKSFRLSHHAAFSHVLF